MSIILKKAFSEKLLWIVSWSELICGIIPISWHCWFQGSVIYILIQHKLNLVVETKLNAWRLWRDRFSEFELLPVQYLDIKVFPILHKKKTSSVMRTSVSQLNTGQGYCMELLCAAKIQTSAWSSFTEPAGLTPTSVSHIWSRLPLLPCSVKLFCCPVAFKLSITE